jgi:hypothetical protein
MEALALDANWHNVWAQFISKIKRTHIHLSGVEDELVWYFNKSKGQYSTKYGYKAMISTREDNALWWY